MTEPDAPRYAVYFAPPAGSALARFGNAWLGRDPERGELLDPPLPDGIDAGLHARLTGQAAVYGFHATLKAPFHLAEGVDEAALLAELEAFAARRTAFEAPGLALTVLGGFLALTLSQPSQAMQALADAAVAELDPLRRPLGEAERARRRAERLPPALQGLLDRWGYPYVFDAFIFHMTLTCRLEGEKLKAARTALARATAHLAGWRLPVREVGLFRQGAAGEPFALIRRFPFGSA